MKRKPSDKSLSQAYSRSSNARAGDSKGTESMRPFHLVLTICLTVCLTAVLVAGVVMVVGDTGTTYLPPAGGSDAPVVTNGLSGDIDTAALYEKVSPSVVSIYSMSDNEGETSSSQGSGFIYDNQGHIITNNHVVNGNSTLYIQFNNGEWTKAELVGSDPYTDLAVLKAEETPEGADPLPMANRLPKEGEPVIALGSPHDLGGTLTTGVVSGVERNMDAHSGFTLPDSIQTDAALNPGNSGGPLITADGKVIGINRAEQGENIGFAISSRLGERVVTGLIADGSVEHSYLGIRSIPLTPPIAEEHGIEETTGVLVVEAVEDGPAQGILQGGNATSDDSNSIPQGGDIIVGIDGEEVQTNEDLSSYLMRMTNPGDTVELELIRDGERKTVEVTLGSR